MKPSLFAALICGLSSVGAMAQSTDATGKPPIILKQTAFVLGEASSKASPAEASSSAASAQASAKDGGQPGPLIATRAADGSIRVAHEGDSAPTGEVR